MERVFLTPLKLVPLEPVQGSISHGVRFNLGGIVELVGYDLEDGVVEQGEDLHLTLYWRATEEVEGNYTVFTHLIDSRGRLWAGWDSQPVEGWYPTPQWEVGEVVRDEYHIPVNDQAPAGSYQIEVGMYDPTTGERLPLLDRRGNVVDTKILLPSNIQIGP